MLRVKRTTAPHAALLDGLSGSWASLEAHEVDLVPTPVVMAVAVSPQLAMRTDHGVVKAVSVRMAHDGETLSIRVAWDDPQRDDRMPDLDRFVDAAAIVFPVLDDANPLTMGDEARPVNAWLWKADLPEPFDVIARGFGTTERRPARHSGLAARGIHQDGRWVVVFQRPLQPTGGEFARFAPGAPAKLSFAVWEGSNAERSGQKAVSGVFLDVALDP